MKILLLNPTLTVFGKVNAVYSLLPPLNLAYIAAYIRHNRPEHNVKIIDCLIASEYTHKFQNKTQYGLTDEKIIEKIRQHTPDIVGITSMYTAFCYDVFRISKLIKQIDKDIKVVVGGSYASEYYEIAIKNENIDFIIRGEGEETFLELLDTINYQKNYHNIKSLVFKENSQIKITPERERIADIDKIPFPARDLLNMDAYFNYAKLTSEGKTRGGFPVTTLFTSRGCPMKCVYCSVKQAWGRKWTYHSPKYVVDEIEHLIKNYGIREFRFLDDSIGVNQHRLDEICNEIIKRNLDISWTTPNGVAHWTLTNELLYKMRKAGCYRITFGIESGNPEMRKYIGKPFSLDDAKTMIKYANKIGMWTICTFIVGFPNETVDQMEDSLRFAIDSGTDVAFFYALITHPKATVYNDYVKMTNNDYLMNILNELSLHAFNDIKAIVELQKALSFGGQINIKQSGEKINEFVSFAHKTFIRKRILRFFTNPIHYLHKIRSYKDAVYLFSVISFSIKVALNILFSKVPNVTMARMLYKKRVLEK